jgi:chromosome segregation ATPase
MEANEAVVFAEQNAQLMTVLRGMQGRVKQLEVELQSSREERERLEKELDAVKNAKAEGKIICERPADVDWQGEKEQAPGNHDMDKEKELSQWKPPIVETPKEELMRLRAKNMERHSV